MKLSSEEAKQRVFDAMLETNGDREAAAKLLGVSKRTFYRYIDELKMKDTIIQMGWDRSPGPIKGTTHGDNALAQTLYATILSRGGTFAITEVGALTKAAFGEDGAKLRAQVLAALSKLIRAGKIEVSADERSWSAVS